MKYKETRSLFLKKYQYKVVLVCTASSLLRGGDIDGALKELATYEDADSIRNIRIRNTYDVTYGKSLCLTLKKMYDYEVRVESPTLSIYTNTLADVNKLIKLYEPHIKYVSKPPASNLLTGDTILMPKMDYDYKVTMAATKAENPAFVQWAEQNSKIKMTKSCKRDLLKSRSWGGTHFYVTGDNNLLMAKMHLGGCISKIQRIIKQ